MKKTKKATTKEQGSKKMNCTCIHEGQDNLHGKGVRVFNRFFKPEPGGYRCTVCSKEVRK